jgi:MoxR-like ATPase
VVSLDELISLQAATDAVRVDRAVVDYAVTVVLATRYPSNYALSDIDPLLTYGGSPRASLGLVRAGRALALIRGRDHLVPQDVFDVAPDVLRHRLVLSYEALAQGVTPDQVLARVLSTVPAPRQASAVRSAYSASATAGPAGGYRPEPGYTGATTAGPAPQGYPTPAPAPAAGYGGPATQPGYGAPTAAGYGPSTGAYPAPAAPAPGAWTDPAAAAPQPPAAPSADGSPWAPDGTAAPSLDKPASPEGPATSAIPGPPAAPPAEEPWPPPGDERSA